MTGIKCVTYDMYVFINVYVWVIDVKSVYDEESMREIIRGDLWTRLILFLDDLLWKM